MKSECGEEIKVTRTGLETTDDLCKNDIEMTVRSSTSWCMSSAF